ncbi:Rna polymerase-associated protein RTF1 [Cardiosporidium cionae]|uniref:Rna polymerase-associated protein RTF1 n=1 Tax=Cardiosporidium cionae TaxID=476202 RepID=A0ABQ7J4T2_9APIC|nr:Rna polymerase-associated protein RTF1 [Cardiosporidium cionae]|eukprot:KAF8818529.1 Rna polymerase-associated protein RTF1 [Cardiosporidium cionae]
MDFSTAHVQYSSEHSSDGKNRNVKTQENSNTVKETASVNSSPFSLRFTEQAVEAQIPSACVDDMMHVCSDEHSLISPVGASLTTSRQEVSYKGVKMGRVRERTSSISSLSEVSSLSDHSQWNPDTLYRDEQDRERLDAMKEFEREAELARRHEEHRREKQRKQLFKEDLKRSTAAISKASGRKSYFVDHPYVKRKKSSELHALHSWDERDARNDSSMEISPLSEESMKSGDGEWTVAAKNKEKSATEDRAQQLFVDERKEEEADIVKDKRNRMRAIDQLSIDLLKPLRLTTENVLHILEHPKAEQYLKGCFVKAAPLQWMNTLRKVICCFFIRFTKRTSSIGVLYNDVVDMMLQESAQLYSIIGLEETVPYSLSGDKMCRFKLIVSRETRSGSSGEPESIDVRRLVDFPITEAEFEDWKNKLKASDFDIEIAHHMKEKLLELKTFTFTDEDVQIILDRNKRSSEKAVGNASFVTSSSLVKSIAAVQHEIDALIMNSDNKVDLKETERNNEKLASLVSEKKKMVSQINAFKRYTVVSDLKNLVAEKPQDRRTFPGIKSTPLNSSNDFGTPSEKRLYEKNPSARRECRPTMMWDIKYLRGDSKTSSKADEIATERNTTACIASDQISDIEGSISKRNTFIHRTLQFHSMFKISLAEAKNVNLSNKTENHSQELVYPIPANTASLGIDSSVLSLEEYTQMTRIAMESM